jgi:hypothetical protein
MAFSEGNARTAEMRRPVRGTQLLVEHMGEVFKQPSLVFIEIAWRWLIGVPLLLVCRDQAQRILAAYPLENSGFNSLDAQNPWVAAVQLSGVWDYYAPHVLAVARWLLPAALVAWIAISGVGRNLVLMRMERGVRFRPLTFAGLQSAWVGLLMVTFWCWFRAMEWAAATHIAAAGEPDLVGYAMWAVFLTLGFFTVWALASWAVSIAPLLALLEDCSAVSALGRSLRLGKAFTSKLAEINLVMGIVKIALLVLAMVFSAAPLPFASELGGGVLQTALLVSTLFFLIANDYFQVVRLKAFVEFWRIFRGEKAAG